MRFLCCMEDISHSPVEVLTRRAKTITVLSEDVEDRDDGPSDVMQPCIAQFRSVFADDLEMRCKLVRFIDGDQPNIEDVPRLPVDIAIGCLLNPLLGGKSALELVVFL